MFETMMEEIEKIKKWERSTYDMKYFSHFSSTGERTWLDEFLDDYYDALHEDIECCDGEVEYEGIRFYINKNDEVEITIRGFVFTLNELLCDDAFVTPLIKEAGGDPIDLLVDYLYDSFEFAFNRFMSVNGYGQKSIHDAVEGWVNSND